MHIIEKSQGGSCIYLIVFGNIYYIAFMVEKGPSIIFCFFKFKPLALIFSRIKIVKFKNPFLEEFN